MATQAVSTCGNIWSECKPTWKLNDTIQDDVVPRKTSTPNGQMMLSVGHKLSAEIRRKESRVKRDAAEHFSARELTIHILCYVDVCCKRMHKQ